MGLTHNRVRQPHFHEISHNLFTKASNFLQDSHSDLWYSFHSPLKKETIL